MIRSEDWSTGDGSTLRGTVRIGSTELPMKISWSPGQEPNVISILGGQPAAIEEFRTLLTGMGDGDKVNLSFSLKYAELQSRQALVRVAYLALFNRFGYRYALSGAGACIRRVITQGDIDAARLLTPQLSDVEEERIKSPIVFSPVVAGEVIVAYLVLIRIQTSQRRHYAALLPSRVVTEDACLGVMAEVANKLSGNHLEIRVSE
jgi:hypothetical protein